MKRLLVVFLLIFTLVVSSLCMYSCDLGTDTGENNNGGGATDDNKPQEKPDEPEKPEEHIHAYAYTLVSHDDGFALEGHCNGAECEEPVVFISVVPEYEHSAPTCSDDGYSLWSYVMDGEEYRLVIDFPAVSDNHSFEDGKCIYCSADEPKDPEQNEHVHSWVDATCATPMTCSTCGEISGNALGHSWTEATCTEARTCSTCGTTVGEVKGHKFKGWYIEVVPTEASEGSVINECLACNYDDVRVLPVLTSGDYKVESIPASCTSNGQNKYIIYIDSIEIGVGIVIRATGHSFEGGSCTSCGVSDPSYVPSTHTHTDSNNDDKCDGCSETVVIIFDFYAINDLHGKFCDTDTQPGVDNLATYLKDRKYYDDNVIIFSSGDMWQGAAESNLTNGKIITEWMNEMDFVSMTLGNHEYDWGEEKIRENLAVAEFPFLAINIYDKTTGKLADYCTPSVVVEMNGFQVGIIGAIGDCYSSISSDMSANVEFKVGSQLTALVKAESDRLRSQGVDLIVYSVHDGDSAYDTALSNGYVDIVFEGHTHSQYVRTDANGIYHIQGGGENQGISHAEIKYNFANEKKTVTAAENIKNSVYSSFDEDPATEALEDKYADVIDMAYTVIGNVSKTQSDSALESIVAELYLKAGLEKWGDKYNIVLGGGFLRTRSPYNLAAGNVTYSDVLSLFPFDNQLVLCSISGTYLKSKFINTTNSDYYCSYSDYGNSIKNSVSSSTTYYVIVDTYTAYYSSNRLTVVDFYDEGVYARDLLAEEIKNGRFDSGSSGGNSGGNSGNTSSDYTLTSIPDILAIGNNLKVGAQTSVDYYVKGTITSIEQTTYGNMYIKDENGNKLLIYGLYDENGTRYDSMTTKPKVGDTIVICGPIYRYNNSTIEIKNGTWISE